VHGGWIQRALNSVYSDGEVHTGWDVVEAAVITDPEKNYRVLSRLNEYTQLTSRAMKRNQS
jgi:hypothetical protein